MAKVCGSGCVDPRGIECSVKHSGLALTYCHEATVQEDSQRRILMAYNELGHCSDVHLIGTPRLAKRAREVRKQLEGCLFKHGSCPPEGACEEIAKFQEELLAEIDKGKIDPIVAAQEVSTNLQIHNSTSHEDYTPFLIIGGVVSLVVGAIVTQHLRAMKVYPLSVGSI